MEGTGELVSMAMLEVTPLACSHNEIFQGENIVGKEGQVEGKPSR